MCEDHPNPFDITLVVKDGKEFPAHRNVLSQASPFFEKLLSTDMKENNEGVIRLEWITESLMADILQFIYTGNVQISTQSNAEKLLSMIKTADYLLLSKLTTMAENVLEQQMTTENCISIYYSIAEWYPFDDLIASTRKFINSNFSTVGVSDDFLTLPNHEVEKWISSDEIVIDAEENVFEIIIRWIYHDESERRVKFGELFRHVRMTTFSRDFLVSDVVTNDLVKENKDCLESVTGALNWYDRSTGCDIPRPHSPRNCLKISGIVITDVFGKLDSCFYIPATDVWYRLPAIEGQPVVPHLISYGGKLLAVTDDIASSQCYDPDLNRWSPAPWTELDSKLPFNTDRLQQVLVVKNEIYFIVVKVRSTDLWKYNPDSNSLTPFFKWIEKAAFSAVAVNRYIYAIGGSADDFPGGSVWDKPSSRSECERFNTEAEEWQHIAPLNVNRIKAFGVCKNEQIFIAGGYHVVGFDCGEIRFFPCDDCEVYSIPTDEWQLIASLSLYRSLGSMVLADDMLYVLGDQISLTDYDSSNIIVSYDHEKNKWTNKAIIPIKKINFEKRHRFSFFKACSLSVFKGVLDNLESIDDDQI